MQPPGWRRSAIRSRPNAGYEYVPSFDKLAEFLASMIALFQAARPELVAAAAGEEPAADGWRGRSSRWYGRRGK